MFDVGARLRKARRRSNLTLDQLATASGVDRGTISRIELGHVSPRVETIAFLCEAMGLDLAAFFAGPGAAPEAPPVLPPEVDAAPAAPALGPDGYWPVPSSFWQGLLQIMARFEILVKNSAELILVRDPAGQVLYASPACETLLDRRGPDLVGGRLLDWLHPADGARLEALVNRLRPTPGATATLDCRFRHRDGSWRWLSCRLSNQLHTPGVQAVILNAREQPAPPRS